MKTRIDKKMGQEAERETIVWNALRRHCAFRRETRMKRQENKDKKNNEPHFLSHLRVPIFLSFPFFG